MAIYSLYNKYSVNYPALITESFVSGMALIIDSNGFVTKADRSLISLDTYAEQITKFIGFASGDHNVTATLMINDPVGSNYIASDGKFIDNTNSYYSVPKRALADYVDESVNAFYMITNNNNSTRRGIGVFNTIGDVYITDQFVPVTTATYLSDLTNQIVFSPGDLLTFGAGVNAGKLVKVDTSGLGPSCMVIGTVERHDPSSGILYFRHLVDSYQNTTTFATTGLFLNLDAANSTSYPGTGTTWYDLSGLNNNGTMTNGVAWSNLNGGAMYFDGSNDYVQLNTNINNQFSVFVWMNPVNWTSGAFLKCLISNQNGGFDLRKRGARIECTVIADGNDNIVVISPTVANNTWQQVGFTFDGLNISTYYNSQFYTTQQMIGTYSTSPTNIRIGENPGWANRFYLGYMSNILVYDRALSIDQIRQNFNTVYQRLIS